MKFKEQLDKWFPVPSDGKVPGVGEQLYPFKVRCFIIQNRPPRHEYFEFTRDIGMVDVDRVFKKRPLSRKRLLFVFPERWMSVVEQNKFMDALATHPDAAELEQVDIVTSNAIIITDFFNDMVRVIEFDKEEE